MKCTVVLGLDCDLSMCEGDIIGVDKGAYRCAKAQIRMKSALGDFDSISLQQKEIVKQYTQEMIVYNPIKDDTDCVAAINWALSNSYDEILVLGGLGGRQDHNYANLRLLKNKKATIVFKDQKNKIFCLGPGRYEISKEEYKYLSLFAQEDSCITIRNVAYPLFDRCLNDSDIYTVSNEISEDKAVLTIKYGRLMVMQCND